MRKLRWGTASTNGIAVRGRRGAAASCPHQQLPGFIDERRKQMAPPAEERRELSNASSSHAWLQPLSCAYYSVGCLAAAAPPRWVLCGSGVPPAPRRGALPLRARYRRRSCTLRLPAPADRPPHLVPFRRAITVPFRRNSLVVFCVREKIGKIV